MPDMPQQFPMPNGDVTLYKALFSSEHSRTLFAELYSVIGWKKETIKLFGTNRFQRRLTAYYGDKSYTYSGITMKPDPWLSALLEIKSVIEPLAGVEFNAVLLNLYRDGNDSIGWHSDDERELAPDSVIGSVSFGATRRFIFRRKDNHKTKVELAIADGDFLVMRGETQSFWQHQVPPVGSKSATQIKPRINLTFRVIN